MNGQVRSRTTERWWALGVCIAMLALGLVHSHSAARATPAVGSAASGGTVARGPVAGLMVHWIPVDSIKPGAPGEVRVGIVTPPHPSADILFAHGHADRLDNHARLFGAWAAAGYRVIAFDLPSHGETNVQPIDVWTFNDLYALIRLVERSTLEDPRRPLLLAGWSFGGLVVTRLAQTPAALQGFARPVRGLILLAPAIDVYPFAGGDGIARTATLTHVPHPRVAGPPRPVAPLLDPIFAVRLLAEAAVSRHTQLPADLPVLVVAADAREDLYVKEDSVLAWARGQRRGGAAVELAQCPGARHSLDNEPYPVGPAVTQLTVDFTSALVGGAAHGRADSLAASACPRR